MLITLFVYATANGVSSSRKIEKLCQADIAFPITCAQDIPDHTPLARFRQAQEEALTDLLGQSLELAANLEILKFGLVALDGTKTRLFAVEGLDAAVAGGRVGAGIDVEAFR